MSEYMGIGYLRQKLAFKTPRVLKRYNYYEMKNKVLDFKISTPESLRMINYSLGWCAKAVDSLADRLCFYEMENDNFGMNEIFGLNNPDVFFDSAILSALISSCCFVYISKDADGLPRLQVIDGMNATGIVDETTGLLTEGYAILDTDAYGVPTSEAYFTAEYTEYIEGGEHRKVPNPTRYPLLVPIVYRPDAKRPFGHSRISRSCMDLVQSACRTIKRSEIAAEFYSYPQKYVVGTSPDAEPLEKWRATISSMLQFTKDEDGDRPTVGQFSQQSMTPHLDQLKMFAGLFAGETGLTLDDLGFVTSNPSSAEAIKASHENLRLTARKAQRTFGSGFLNVGYLATSLRDGKDYLRNAIYDTKASWMPIFEPDANMMGAIGDGILKLNQAIPDYVDEKTIRELTGIVR